MKLKFSKFIPLLSGKVSIMLEGTDADIPELVTFLRKDVWLSQIQTEISESRIAILQDIRSMAEQIAEAIAKELYNDMANTGHQETIKETPLFKIIDKTSSSGRHEST